MPPPPPPPPPGRPRAPTLVVFIRALLNTPFRSPSAPLRELWQRGRRMARRGWALRPGSDARAWRLALERPVAGGSAAYDWKLVSYNGVSLTAAPFRSVYFDERNGPSSTRVFDPVEAAVAGTGDRDVRSQPKGANWDIHIWLATTTQADYALMAQTFSEELGQAYLIANDGDGNPYRVLARTVQLVRVDAVHHIARTRVADATWEENALTTTTRNDKSGASDAVAITNNGNRRARPVVATDIDAQKSPADPAVDFTIHRRGYDVNRAPRWYTAPRLLLTFDAATLIRDTSKRNLLNGAINASVTTININTPTGGGLPAGAGFAYIDVDGGNAVEQIYYAANSGTALTGVVRGCGGTVAGAHGNAAQINRSSIRADGDDVRLYINGKEVERDLGNWNTSTSKVWWRSPSLPPRVKLTPVAGQPVGGPAPGGSIAFVESVADLAEAGLLLDNFGNTELFAYNGRDLANHKVLNVTPGVWSTDVPIGVASPQGPTYRCDALFVVAMGKRDPGPAPAPAERRPCFDLNLSDNATWHYCRANDTSSRIVDPANPARPAQFQPSYEVPAGDKNHIAIQPQISSNGSTRLRYAHNSPVIGQLGAPRLRLRVPAGIKAAAGGITYDCEQGPHLRMRMLGRDSSGQEVELVDRWDAAAAAVTGQTVTPPDILYELILDAVPAVVTGNDLVDKYIDILPAGTVLWQKFIIDEPTPVSALFLQLYKNGGDTVTALVNIWDSTGATPPASRKLITFSLATGAIPTAAAYIPVTPSSALVLQPATYWLEVNCNSGAGTLHVGGSVYKPTRNDLLYLQGPNTYSTDSIFFKIVHAHGGPVQADVDQIIPAALATAAWKNIILALNDAAADPYTPLVQAINDDAGGYHCIGRLTNSRNAFAFNLDLWLLLTATNAEKLTVNVDCEKKQVTVVDANGWLQYAAGAVDPDNAAEWFALEPGSNTVTYTEANMANTDIVYTHRGKKV